MIPANPLSIPTWDETISSDNIQAGTALTMKLPELLLFRRVCMYMEAIVSTGPDFYILADVLLELHGVPQIVLPFNIGKNSYAGGGSLVVPDKSLISAFYASSVFSVVPAAATAVLVNLSRLFYETRVLLNPAQVICRADRLTLRINDWSKTPSTNVVTGFRALGYVLSANHAF